ncbi:putative RNA-dependent RNA-polymerase [Euproctis pseudoconspersa bunyavirus]|uniref:RNA-directed RNA polymerase L n=1 Tax=Euproctis pseudoconspersa bunyavirus TaxID=2769516 RepID=A0A7H0S6L2_9VIRU|nr:putative RNA-dependent RNA-polymerase [Euproctis pseudoconspersa bunyavirus]QNQ79763.1 putative RNA-dependent RNA-polymerase [Euproctis pseudoconspersa bunyavirus]
MDFLDILRENLRDFEYRPGRFAMNSDPFIHGSNLEQLPPIELFKFEQCGDKIEWAFTPVTERTWGGSHHGSMVGKAGTLTYKEMETVRHELACNLIFGKVKTDVKLSTIYRLGQRSDNLTPDGVIMLDDITIVVEVGTTRVGHEAGVRAAYNEKLNKYAGFLHDMALKSGKCIYYVVIAVGPNNVASSIELTDELYNDLIYRTRMGIRFERAYQSSGLRIVTQNVESDHMINLRSSIYQFGKTISRSNNYGFDDLSHDQWSLFEPNQAYIDEMEDFILTKTADNMLEGQRISPQQQVTNAFYKLESDIVYEGGVRTDTKSPIQIPLFKPEIIEGCKPTFEVVPNEVNDISDILELWNLATSHGLFHPERFSELTEEQEEIIAMEGNKKTKEERNLARKVYHRVDISELSSKARVMLAMDGFQAKKYWKDECSRATMAERRLYTQSSFSPSSPIDDITACVNYRPQAESIESYWREWTIVERLLTYANELAGNSNEGFDAIKSVMNSDVAVGLTVIAMIAVELSVSHKQNCKSDEMIYKRLNGLACELLIYPTNSRSHIFFTIRYKGHPVLGDDDATFRKAVKVGDWYYTPMLSVNADRLENMIKAPFTWANSIIHWRIWYGNYGRDEVGDGFHDLEEDVTKLAWLTTLISLEDKSTTEELASSIRYIAMQFFKGDDPASPLDLEGPIGKMPTVLRSRLAVYLFISIKQWCLAQSAALPEFNFDNLKNLKEDRNGDDWINLLCPFIMKQVRNVQCIIQIFYLSYAKNKNTSPSENSDYALVKKILAHGTNKDDTKPDLYNGRIDPEPTSRPKPHTFSKNAFSAACKIARDELIGAEGQDYKKHLDDRIISELIHKASFEAMGTLKASFNYDAETLKTLSAMQENEEKLAACAESQGNRTLEYLLAVSRSGSYMTMPMPMQLEIADMIREERKKNKLLKRIHQSAARSKSCKCMEAVIKAIADLDTDSCLPLEAISQVYNNVLNSWGGICCYLFKKNQHGGIREIYVLTFYSRILQLFVETVGRVLCSYFPMETMTHPNEKTNAIQTHFSKVKKLQLSSYEGAATLTRASSEDKSKWSQNNNVSCYAFILSQILSPEMAKACLRVLSLWKTKKILLPEGVVKMLESDLEKPDDKIYEALRKEYWGRSPSKYLDKAGGKFLITDTGMWQGILHYISSFQHVLQVLHYKQFIARYIGPQLRSRKVISYELTNLVSSDDSLTLMTVLVDEEGLGVENMKVINQLMALALHSEDLHSSFFMMQESPKSCMASTTVFEFNSIFHIAQGAVSPVIKKVLCCTNIIQSESFVTKFRSTYNAVKDILEEGGGHYQVHLHQIICGLLHYFVMGSCTTSLFRPWAEICLEGNPNPHTGFYLMDIDLIAGIMGYEFMQYNSLINTRVPVTMSSNQLKKFSQKGTFNNAILFMHGNRKRWTRLKERIEVPGWSEQIDNRPEILYKAFPDTAEEARLRLCMKAHSKGVYEALVVGGKLASIVASTVYMLREPVMAVRSTDYDINVKTDDLDVAIERASLLKVTFDLSSEQSLDVRRHIDMDEKCKSLYYSNYNLYDNIIRMVATARPEVIGEETTPYRKVKNTVLLRAMRADSRVPLMTCCRKIWFGMDVKSSSTLLEESWKTHVQHFPWLHSDKDVSLDRSPFMTHSEMYRFIQGLQDTSSSVRILCKRFSSNQTYGKIRESLLYNQYPGYRLILSGRAVNIMREETIDDAGTTKEFQSVINLLLMFPGSLKDKMALFSSVLDRQNFEFNEHMLTGLTQSEARQMILIAHLSGVDDGRVIEMMTRLSGHVISYFSIAQKQIAKGKWGGYGCLTLAFKSYVVECHMVDNYIVYLTTTDIEGLKSNSHLIENEIEKAGLIIPNTATRQRLFRSVPSYVYQHQRLKSYNPTWSWTDKGIWRNCSNIMIHPPIYELQYRELVSDPASVELRLKQTDDNQLSLIAYSEVSGQYTTLCNYYAIQRVKPVDDLSDRWDWPVDEDNSLECWIFNTPWSANAAKEELKMLKTLLETDNLEQSKREEALSKFDFYQKTFIHRAVFKNQLQKTPRISNLDEATDAIMEAGNIVTDIDVELINAALDETVSVAKNVSKGGVISQVADKIEDNSLESKAIDTRDWLDRIMEMGSSASASGAAISHLRQLENRVEAGIRVDVVSRSYGGEVQAYFLHRLWDGLLDHLAGFGILEAFNRPRVMARTFEQTFEMLEWLLGKPSQVEFMDVPFS